MLSNPLPHLVASVTSFSMRDYIAGGEQPLGLVQMLLKGIHKGTDEEVETRAKNGVRGVAASKAIERLLLE